MKLDPQDWRKLQAPLIALGVVVIVVALLIGFAESYRASQKQALQTQQNLLNAARQRYQALAVEKDTIAEYLPQYQALIDKGFVGEERRMEWVDELRAQHKLQKLFGIKYSISQQQNYRPAFAPSLGGFIMHRSVMKLDLDMLHEGDILQLTESLSANKATPFMLRDCEVTRLNGGGSWGKQLIANLHAACEMDWLTLREPAPAQPVVLP